jgi:hypothetical protein
MMFYNNLLASQRLLYLGDDVKRPRLFEFAAVIVAPCGVLLMPVLYDKQKWTTTEKKNDWSACSAPSKQFWTCDQLSKEPGINKL